MITDYIKHMNYTESIEYKDGIYICYEDGHKELFDKGKNTKSGIKYIGVVWENMLDVCQVFLTYHLKM